MSTKITIKAEEHVMHMRQLMLYEQPKVEFRVEFPNHMKQQSKEQYFWPIEILKEAIHLKYSSNNVNPDNFIVNILRHLKYY